VKSISRTTGVLIAAAAFAALGSGVAEAKDPLVGKTYSDAVSTIAGWNGTAIVAARSGSVLETDDCIVVSWKRSIFRDTSGIGRAREFLLNINCTEPLASPGHPGNSAVSPQGRQAKEENNNAEYIAKNSTICDKDENTAKWCTDLCDKTGKCDYGS